ncbi:MAG: M1 family peptidase, partial [Deltaproteobacteria bacterium]|nr:M1 family peptidase [Deltaproteobacteria bacterium]
MPTPALALLVLLLTAPPEVDVAGWEAGAVRSPSSPGAWGGPRTGKEATLSDRVADYAIRAVLDPTKHTITGTEKLTWRNRSDVAIRSVYLHLYLNAFESEGSTFQKEARRYGAFRTGVETKDGEWGWIELRGVAQGGRPAAWSFVHPDGGPETDHTVVRVDLPVPVAPGGTTTLEIEFFDQLPRVVARTGWFDAFHLAGQWYPKIGVLELPGERGATRPRWNAHEMHFHSEFYADFGAYDLE